MRKAAGSAVWLVIGAVYALFPAIAQGQETLQRHGEPGTASPALTVNPACPEVGDDRTTHQFKSEAIAVRYEASAKSALFHSPSALTLQVAPIWLSRQATIKDVPMTRQRDGTWLASFDLTGAEAGTGYLMFDVEDHAHQIDKNHGAYWDLQLCRFGKAGGAQMKAYSYEGQILAPGIQRAPDLARALAIVRQDFAANPQNYGDLFWIWTFETGNGTGSPAAWEQVSREIDEALAKNADQPIGQHNMLSQTIGFVAFNQTRIDPAVVAKYRAAVAALPQTEQPARYGKGGQLYPIVCTPEWNEAESRMVTVLLSELDFPQSLPEAEPRISAAAYEAYAKKYNDCTDCRYVAGAFGRAVLDYAKSGDLDAAQRVASQWMAWDPKNPDPPATLAEQYLKAKARLHDALQLADRAEQLYVPCAEISACQANFRAIHSQMYFVVSPGTNSKGKIEFLRGRIEAALGDWTAAAKDLRTAAAAMPDDKNVQSALSEANEHAVDDTSR